MTLDNVMDLSFDQIHLSARCVMRHKMSMINTVFEPIAAAFGDKKAKSKISKKTEKQQKAKMSPEQKDAMLLMKAKQMGISVV